MKAPPHQKPFTQRLNLTSAFHLPPQHTPPSPQVEQKLSEIAEEKERGIYPIDDSELHRMSGGVPLRFPPPEGSALPGIGHSSMTDLLVVFDFFSKFYRSLSLVKTNLDDFASALTCVRKHGSNDSDAVEAIPPFLSECHVAVLRMLVQDDFKEEWWRAENRVMLSDSIPEEKGESKKSDAQAPGEAVKSETAGDGEEEDDDSVKTDTTVDEVDDDPDFVINEFFDRPRPRTMADKVRGDICYSVRAAQLTQMF